MAEEEVVIRMTAKDASVVRAWQAAQQSIAAYNAQLGKLDDTQRANAKAAAEFDRANAQAMKNAKAVLEGLLTPQQRYQQSLEKLASLHSRGLITVEQYLAAMNKEKTALDASDPALQRAIERKRQLEAAGRQLTESTRTAGEKYRVEVARLNDLLNAGTISQETHSRAVRKAREDLLQASGHVSKRTQAEAALAEQLKQTEARERERGETVRRVLASIQTPQERYNAELKKLTTLRGENRLSEDQYAAAVKRAKGELDASNESTNRGADLATMFAGKLVGVAAAVGGIAAIAARLRAEYDDLLQRQGKAADSQITLAAAQRSAVFNLGSDESLSPKDMTDELSQISKKTGVREELATKVFSDMLSARGGMKARDVLPRLESVLNAAPDQSGLPVLGGATMSLGTEFGLTGDQSLGFMLQTQAASPVVSLESLAHHSVPAIVSTSKFGDSPEQAAELVAGLASAGKDSRGAESGTAAVQLADRLEKVLPKMKSTAERLEAVRKSKSLQAKVFADSFGEAKYKPIFRELLTGSEDAPAVQAYRSAQSAIQSPQEAAPVLAGLLDQYGKLPLSGTAQAQRTLDAEANRMRNADLFGGQSHVIRKGLEDVMEADNVSKTIRDLVLTKYDATTQLGNTAPLEAGITELRRQADEKLNPMQMVPTIGVGEFSGYISEPRSATAEEKRSGQSLSGLADTLQRLLDAQQQQNALVAAQLEEQKKANQRPIANDIRPNMTPAGPVPSAANDSRSRP